jgi:serine/threonine protein kinase
LDQEQIKALDFSVSSRTNPIISEPGNGTLTYSAPEIFSGKSATTATDVYAFGVTAFQLLTGEFCQPLSPGWESFVEDPLLRLDLADYCNLDPNQRPSFHEITLRFRSLEARRIQAELLEAEQTSIRAERIESEKRAHQRELDAARIEYLTRRRVLLRFSVAVLVSMLGLAGYGFWKARQQAKLAIEQQSIAQQKSADLARALNKTELVKTLVFSEINLSVNPFERGNADAKVRDLLPKLADEIAAKLADEPSFAAQLLEQLSASLTVTGQQQKSSETLRKALTLVTGKDDLLEAAIANRIGDDLRLQGRQAEAGTYYQRSLTLYKKQRILSAQQDLKFARTLLGLADVLLRQGRSTDGLQLVEDAAHRLERSKDVQDTLKVAAWSLHGRALLQLGQLDQARVQYQKVITYSQTSETGNPTQTGMRGLAKEAILRGNAQLALQIQSKALAALEKTMPNSPTLSNARIELVEYLLSSQEKSKAQSLLNAILGADGQGTALAVDYRSAAKFLLAKVLCETERQTEAASVFSNALAEAKTAFGEDSVRYQEMQNVSLTNPRCAPSLSRVQ